MAIDLSKYITSVRVDTAYLPPMVLDDPFAPGPPNPLLQALKPKVTIGLKGLNPVVLKPYGEPGPSKYEDFKAGAVVVFPLLVTLLARKIIR